VPVFIMPKIDAEPAAKDHGIRARITARTVAIAAACAISGGVVIAALIVYEPPIAKVAPPDPSAFPTFLVQRGATLAAIGDCTVCHTALGGQPYAGARPLPTPFGTMFVSNITPDAATGIGNWSPEAFRRAMVSGIARDGSHLYPALPYEHFTHVSADDLDAIYAFLMTRRAVSQPTPPNRLTFPFGFRPILAGWNLLFLHHAPFQPSRDESDLWNRGAYLVEGLGHCGGCHTPRNLAGGEERSRAYAGGVAEGWNAPALDHTNAAPLPWTVESLTTYLRTGFEREHGVAAGPMGPVTQDLAEVPDSDVRAIATYVVWLMRDRAAAAPQIDAAPEAAHHAAAGAVLFAGACAGCHENGAPMVTQGRPALEASSDIQQDDPRNAIQAILQGIQPPLGQAGAYMPSFADALTDAQIADVSAYLRARFSARPAWTDLPKAVATARREGGQP
jgi:mono/diheme cytochrome c family protein